MGKKQHSKDRMFITSTEWATEWGGAKRATATALKKLPFNCCALTFTPFEEPVCTDEGHVFDVLHIVPYIQKFGKNPVTGKPLALKDLRKLKFHKNADGEYHCPVLNKVFTEFTHIVAVRTTGNVFSYEAIKELNIKPKNWKELLTDEPFTRKDVITLQDPQNGEARLLTDFDFVKKDVSLDDLGIGSASESASQTLNLSAAGRAVQRALEALPSSAGDALRLGGGGAKSQREQAAALAVIEAARKTKEERERGREGAGDGSGAASGSGRGQEGEVEGREAGAQAGREGSQPDSELGLEGAAKDSNGNKGVKKAKGKRKGNELQGQDVAPAWSVVDAASAAVAGRSAAAAKVSDEKKTKALVAAHAAGERKPVAENSKWVKSKFTSGATSRGLTSTVFTPTTETQYELVQVERNPKKKGYCRLHTTLGDLNLELHCDLAPRTCENFLTLAQRGYYDGTVFHRSIRNFMLQGGDPTGTGKGGQSIWGKPFKDEFDGRLLHSERGVVSMANSGPHSNGSQFFILYKSAAHLNFKHAVFGKLVGGLETLTKMERVETDEDDRPLEDVRITGITIFVNPYLEEEGEEEEGGQAKKKELTLAEQQELDRVGSWFSNPRLEQSSVSVGPGAVAGGGGVGKYLKRVGGGTDKNSGSGLSGTAKDQEKPARLGHGWTGFEGEREEAEPPKKAAKAAADSGVYGNFSNW